MAMEYSEAARISLKAIEQEKEATLLEEIRRATNDERIRWLPTAKLSEFTGSFEGRWSVLVGRDEQGEYYVEITDAHGHLILRRNSRDIQVLTVPTSTGVNETVVNPVRELFEAVSGKAFHSDKGIDEFLRELKRA